MPVQQIISYPVLRKTFTNKTLRICIENLLNQFIQLSECATEMKSELANYTDQNVETALITLQTSKTTFSILQELLNWFSIENKTYTEIENNIKNVILPHLKSDSFVVSQLIQVISIFLTDMNISDTTKGWYLYSREQWDMIIKFFRVLNTMFGMFLVQSTSEAIIFSIQPKDHPLYMYSGSKVVFIKSVMTQLNAVITVIDSIQHRLLSQLPCSLQLMTSLNKQWQSLVVKLTQYKNNFIALFENTSHSFHYSLTVNENCQLLLYNDTTQTPFIYADGKPPVQNDILDAWKYTNSVSGKINWYFGANATPLGIPIDSSLLFGSIKSIYFIIQYDSVASLPFLALYSHPNGVSWYGNKKVYSVYSPAPTTGKKILVYQGTDPRTLPITLGSFDDVCVLLFDSTGGTTTFKSNKGDTDLPSTDTVLFISFHTDSSASINNVNFSLKEFGYYRNDTVETMSSKFITKSLPGSYLLQ